MALVVQKYGGSSLESAERIRAVAERIVATKKQGHDVVVVCSAMGDTTDELLDLAAQVNPVPPQREMDMLLTAGERISNALVAMAVESLGAHALGSACGILYGYVALVAKAVVDVFSHEGPVATLGSWELYALIALAAGGTVIQQYSFHAGALAHSLPAMTIMEPIVAFGLGYWVLGEKFQVSSAAGWCVMAGSLLVMIVATIVLSRVPVNPGSTTRSSS